MFITAIHPFAKIAAAHFNMEIPLIVCVSVSSDDYPNGNYPFLIYSWDYTGHKPERKLISVCNNTQIQNDLFELLQNATTASMDMQSYQSGWGSLESTHFLMWQSAKEQHIENVSTDCRYKMESQTNNWRNRKRNIELKISEAVNPNILRMYNAELDNAERVYNEKMDALKAAVKKADIHTVRLVCGVILVKRS